MKQIKTYNALVKEIAKREGKKKQVDIAQIREIVSIISDLIYEDYERYEHEGEPGLCDVLLDLGEKRAKKKAKK